MSPEAAKIYWELGAGIGRKILEDAARAYETAMEGRFLSLSPEGQMLAKIHQNWFAKPAWPVDIQTRRLYKRRKKDA